MSELEAKYLVAAGRKPRKVFRRVLQELSWAGFMARPRNPLLLNDSYFDTADWAGTSVTVAGTFVDTESWPSPLRTSSYFAPR